MSGLTESIRSDGTLLYRRHRSQRRDPVVYGYLSGSVP